MTVTTETPTLASAAVQAALEVENLEVTYSRVIVAVRGVSLTVPDNSIVALLGTNGAGKSTTVRAISGFLPVDDAEIKKGFDPFRWRSPCWGCRPTRSRARASCWCPSVARSSRR